MDKLYWIDILNNFTNYFEFNITQNLGFAFCGSLITVLLISFFINKNITLKEKIIYAYLLIFFLLPVIFPKIYRIWHGGSSTHGFNFRYCYLTMFVFITIAFKSYKNIENNTKKHFIILYIFFGIPELLKIIHFFNLSGFEKRFDYLLKLVLSIIIIFSNITIIWISANKSKNEKIQHIMFIICLIIEILDICLVIKYNIVFELNVDDYNKDAKMISYVADKIEVPEMERVIIDNDENGNSSLKYNYSTFYFFASGRNIKTLSAMNKIGYTTYYVEIDKNSKTFIMM